MSDSISAGLGGWGYGFTGFMGKDKGIKIGASLPLPLSVVIYLICRFILPACAFHHFYPSVLCSLSFRLSYFFVLLVHLSTFLCLPSIRLPGTYLSQQLWIWSPIDQCFWTMIVFLLIHSVLVSICNSWVGGVLWYNACCRLASLIMFFLCWETWQRYSWCVLCPLWSLYTTLTPVTPISFWVASKYGPLESFYPTCG